MEQVSLYHIKTSEQVYLEHRKIFKRFLWIYEKQI